MYNTDTITMTKEESVELYGEGFVDGVSGMGPRYEWPWPKEYCNGMNDGVQAFRDAMDKVRIRLECPLTSTIQGGVA